MAIKKICNTPRETEGPHLPDGLCTFVSVLFFRILFSETANMLDAIISVLVKSLVDFAKDKVVVNLGLKSALRKISTTLDTVRSLL